MTQPIRPGTNWFHLIRFSVTSAVFNVFFFMAIPSVLYFLGNIGTLPWGSLLLALRYPLDAVSQSWWFLTPFILVFIGQLLLRRHGRRPLTLAWLSFVLGIVSGLLTSALIAIPAIGERVGQLLGANLLMTISLLIVSTLAANLLSHGIWERGEDISPEPIVDTPPPRGVDAGDTFDFDPFGHPLTGASHSGERV